MKQVSYKALAWASLGALIYCLCFPRWDIFYLAPFVLPCYLFAIHSLKSRKEAILLGFLISFIIGIGGFHWIVFVAENFGQLPLIGALGMLFAYCLVAAPHIIALFWLGHNLRYRAERLPLALRPLFWALLYTALEFLVRGFKVFPENLGNTLIGYLPLAQSASIGGVSLLSFLPLYLGASLYYFRKEKIRALSSLLVSIALIVGLSVWGKQEIQRLALVKSKPLHIAVLQANIGDIDKIASEKGNANAIRIVIQKYLDLAKEAKGADLAIWPETAYPLSFPARIGSLTSTVAQGYANLVLAGAGNLNTSFLMGGYEQENEQDFNSGILIGANGKAQGSYRKVKLLIFGEWMPFANWFPSLKQLNPQMGDFGMGEGPIPVKWQNGINTYLVGVNICYEAILPEYMHELAKNGAEFFLNITNDSWFGPTLEPWQHLQLAELRAIENRKPFVRATNTGLSVFIDTAGHITTMGPLFEAAVVRGTLDIPDENIPSIYFRFGELFAWLTVAASAGFLAFLFKRF